MGRRTIDYKILFYTGLFLLTMQSVRANSAKEDKQPMVLAMSKPVPVPLKIEFASETMDVSRYDLYERLDRELNAFTYTHSTTMLLFKRANRYFPIIEPILKANGIPDDFKYLAVIESSLNVRAVSPAKAAGLWQLMPATATEYGLEVSSEVDERFAVEKSTEAACKYLKMAYARYGSWINAAVSYNAGMGRISSELSSQQGEMATDLWLVEESHRYFFRMAAIKLIFESPFAYGYVLTADNLYKPMKFREVKVESSIASLTDFAKQQGISYADLKEFNSWLRDRKLTVSAGKQYVIKIPTAESLRYGAEKVQVHDKRWIAY